MTDKKMTLAVFGGSVDTGNNGVSALGIACIKGLHRNFPHARLILQTWRDVPATIDIKTEDGPIPAEAMLIYESPEATPGSHKLIRRLKAEYDAAESEEERSEILKKDVTFEQLMHCDAALDITSGDSFADIYGPYRSATPLLLKELGIPLIWLPQTYGPFKYDETFKVTQELFDYSDLIATRESNGENELRELFNITQPIYTTPDVAFIHDAIAPDIVDESLVANKNAGEVLVGLNVSGLLYFTDRSYFGLKADYRELCEGIARTLLDRNGVKVLLVPHVIGKEEPTENDVSKAMDLPPTKDKNDAADTLACRVLMRKLKEYGDRVDTLKFGYGSNETWYFISQCDFFMGGRMHPCIGAASRGVAVAPIAYSKKAYQVLSQLGIGDAVIDPRKLDTPDCIAKAEKEFERRADIQRRISSHLPGIRTQLYDFFDGPLKVKLEELSRR